MDFREVQKHIELVLQNYFVVVVSSKLSGFRPCRNIQSLIHTFLCTFLGSTHHHSAVAISGHRLGVESRDGFTAFDFG